MARWASPPPLPVSEPRTQRPKAQDSTRIGRISLRKPVRLRASFALQEIKKVSVYLRLGKSMDRKKGKERGGGRMKEKEGSWRGTSLPPLPIYQNLAFQSRKIHADTQASLSRCTVYRILHVTRLVSLYNRRRKWAAMKKVGDSSFDQGFFFIMVVLSPAAGSRRRRRRRRP